MDSEKEHAMSAHILDNVSAHFGPQLRYKNRKFVKSYNTNTPSLPLKKVPERKSGGHVLSRRKICVLRGKYPFQSCNKNTQEEGHVVSAQTTSCEFKCLCVMYMCLRPSCLLVCVTTMSHSRGSVYICIRIYVCRNGSNHFAS